MKRRENLISARDFPLPFVKPPFNDVLTKKKKKKKMMYSTFAAMNIDSEQEFGKLNHVVYMRWPFSSQSSLSLLTGMALARGKGGPGDT